MSLILKNVAKRVGGETFIHPTSMVFEKGSFNVLLGTTLAGKTTLMQLIAGIQLPSSGHIYFDDKDITQTPVQQRNISFVYQQFINYPNFTVFENIASPLRLAKLSESEINKRVKEAANLLQLTPLLQRKPSELSGGQQQRTALARAIVKDSVIILLDEPLANLDYKLREELRDELPKLFADREAIVIYATTEPLEALLFGGTTATLYEGRVTQFGPTREVYHHPKDLISAQVFSEPPMSTTPALKKGKQLTVFGHITWPIHKPIADGDYIIGVRPHNISTERLRPDMGEINGRVLVAEISGSESIIHLAVEGSTWICQVHGIYPYKIGDEACFYVDTDKILFFDTKGEFIG